MAIFKKPLKFGVHRFLNYENRFSGSKFMIVKPKDIAHFWNVQIFDKISLIECILGNTNPNHLLFFKYIQIEQRIIKIYFYSMFLLDFGQR